MTRVAAIGLDAAEWSVIEELIEAGEMPNLARLRERSTECRLRNVVPYRSELPWTQFLTGRTAETNRYWSTVVFDPASYEAHCVGAHPATPFYALGPDTKVIAFDIPHSVIDPSVTGLQVTAWGAHSSQYPRASMPKGLLTEIDERFGQHPAFDNDYDGGWHQPRFLDNLGEALLQGCRRRADAARWLLTEREPDWDLFITVLSESHSGGHHYWHGVDPAHPLHAVAATSARARRWLRRVYRAQDDAVGRIAEVLDDDVALVVFSVHGMQVNANDVPSLALLPELVHRQHFGTPLVADVDQEKWKRSGYRPVEIAERLIWRQALEKRRTDREAGGLASVLPDAVIAAARAVQRSVTGRPRPAWDFPNRSGPECELDPAAMSQQRKSLRWQTSYWYRDHWPQMKWFVLPTFSDAHVRINLEGRERDGVVAADDYKRACDDFEEMVRACRNPRTGRPVVDEVVRMRAADPFDPDGPDSDLVVVWSEATDALEHPDVGIVGPLPYSRTGEHSANGFAFFSGAGIERGDLGERSAFDMTPTLLALLGADPTTADFEGTPLPNLRQ